MSRQATFTPTNEPMTTRVAEGTRVSGNVEGHESIYVEGCIEGSITLDESVYVEPNGVVLAEVKARHVVVDGIVVGQIEASEGVVLRAGARVVGAIRTPRLTIAEGAAHRGQVDMGEFNEGDAESSLRASASRSRERAFRGRSAGREATGRSRDVHPIHGPSVRVRSTNKGGESRGPIRRVRSESAKDEGSRTGSSETKTEGSGSTEIEVDAVASGGVAQARMPSRGKQRAKRRES